MKSCHTKGVTSSNSRGGVLVLVVALFTVLMGIAAFAIDFGYFFTTRNELQNVADSAALAGAGYLGSVYVTLPPAQQSTHTFTKAEIENVIQEVAQTNYAAGLSVTIETSNDDIVVGMWDPSSGLVTPTLTGPDAVYVKARRDENNSPISTFFAGIIGVDTMSVTAEAVAALSGPSTVAEGELITPFGLSEHNFPNNCTDLISFSPTTSSCAAWHNFFDPINANTMAEKLIGFIQGDTSCEHCDGLSNGPTWLETNFNISKTPDSEVTPAAGSGDYFEFQGGAIASLFNGNYLGVDYNGISGTVYINDKVDTNPKSPAPIIALFDYFRYRDGDGDDTVWTATVPVYKDLPDGICMNANTAIEILGFAKIVVLFPDPPPSTNIKVHVDCNFSVVDGRGGGGTYGNIRGTIPNLVK